MNLRFQRHGVAYYPPAKDCDVLNIRAQKNIRCQCHVLSCPGPRSATSRIPHTRSVTARNLSQPVQNSRIGMVSKPYPRLILRRIQINSGEIDDKLARLGKLAVDQHENNDLPHLDHWLGNPSSLSSSQRPDRLCCPRSLLPSEHRNWLNGNKVNET